MPPPLKSYVEIKFTPTVQFCNNYVADGYLINRSCRVHFTGGVTYRAAYVIMQKHTAVCLIFDLPVIPARTSRVRVFPRHK